MTKPTREDAERLMTDEGLKGAYWDELAMEIAQAYPDALDVVEAARETLRALEDGGVATRLPMLEKTVARFGGGE